MAEQTKIEWADSTFNPWVGCTKISPACDNCYAAVSAPARVFGVKWGAGQPRRRTSDSTWKLPERWNARAEQFHAEHGRRQRVFCASLADVFDNEVPPSWRANLMSMVVRTPHLDWLMLTKRVGSAKRMLSDASMHDGMLLTANDEYRPPANLWIGATVVTQAEADRDIPKLLAVPAVKRFLSIEPMLGPINIEPYLLSTYDKAAHDDQMVPGLPTTDRLDWIIVGGESGPGARPMHPDWVRSVRDQCDAAGVPFLFKQWGEWLPGQNDVHPHENGRRVAHHQDGSWGVTKRKVNASNYVAWDESGSLHRGSLINAPSHLRVHAWAQRVGKKTAGRLLDGREWNEAPA